MGEGVGEGEKMVEWGVNGDERKVNGGIGGRNCVRRNEKRGGGGGKKWCKEGSAIIPCPITTNISNNPLHLSIYPISSIQSSELQYFFFILPNPFPTHHLSLFSTSTLIFQSFSQTFLNPPSTLLLSPPKFRNLSSFFFSTLQPFLQPPIFPSVPSIP